MVAFSLQLAEKQRTAILYDESDPYTRFLSEQISRNIHEVSGYKPLMLSYHGSQKDYRALLLQAKTNGVRLIIAPGYTDDVILQLTQAHSLAMDNLWLGSDAWDLEKIALIDDFDGAYVFQLAVPNIENTDDKLKYFAERFYQRYRRPITLGSMVSADSIAILLQAIKDVDSTSPELVSQYMRRGFVFDGFVGHYQFDENGDPNLQARFFRIKNHEIIEVEAKLR
jgi:branched-chain amino acid transport system substrate-binding protein